MLGLYQAETNKAPTVGLLPKCGACKLDRGCKSPKMPVTGYGRKGILIVTNAPDLDDDREGQLFVGEPGQYLRRVLADNDVDLDRDCWKTSALICAPPEREPTDDEIDHCRPSLLKVIRELKPRHIIPLGKTAITSLLAPLWREAVGGIEKWVGWQIPLQAHNAWVTPNYGPKDVQDAGDSREGPVIKVWFERYLAQAVALTGRPYEVIPNYESEVRIVMDPEAVAAWIDEKLQVGGAFSFDYETDRLKPDHPEAQIVCASICWVWNRKKRETIAFPWVGAAISAFGRMLRSRYPKIGANNKFESRWSIRFFGEPVVNFTHDVCIVAHVLDNRRDITSLKFQAFIRCGVPDWSSSIAQYLDGDGGNTRNRIREANLRKLLLYNGIDSLLCYLVAMHQKDELKKVLKNG
jgi:uracil-DNA glycosylase family 4